MGLDPVSAYRALVLGSVGNLNAVGETLVKAVPLMFTGLSFAFAFRCGLINIGAEGQLYMGGLLSVCAGVFIKGLPALIHLPLALAAGFAGGGLWGLISGWLKTRFGASEIITTVMLNYVAIYFVSYLVTGPLKAPPGNFPHTEPVAVTAELPRILAGTRLHLGFIFALLAICFYYVFLWHTREGFELRVVGQNTEAAKYAGMKPSSSIMTAMFLAGGMGGLAGAGEILGVQHRLMQAFSPGYGFDGIAVALLGLNTPLGIFLAAVLFGILRSGGNMMQMMVEVPIALIYIIQALVILFVVAQIMAKPSGRRRLRSFLRDFRLFEASGGAGRIGSRG
ncbi:MAG TPA: ABC transporter permease [Clostridia bacterium]|nr:ABC transporter permease [Clostridia bacterium]